MMVTIERCTERDLDAWASLRAALWPDASETAHRIDLEDLLLTARSLTGFIARDPSGTPVAFAEAALRTDWVNGCETTPVAFLEGLYVTEAFRRQGIARGLIAAVENWARLLGCEELASDALLDNLDSHAMHGALDFEETERVVYFRKVLNEFTLAS